MANETVYGLRVDSNKNFDSKKCNRDRNHVNVHQIKDHFSQTLRPSTNCVRSVKENMGFGYVSSSRNLKCPRNGTVEAVFSLLGIRTLGKDM